MKYRSRTAIDIEARMQEFDQRMSKTYDNMNATLAALEKKTERLWQDSIKRYKNSNSDIWSPWEKTRKHFGGKCMVTDEIILPFQKVWSANEYTNLPSFEHTVHLLSDKGMTFLKLKEDRVKTA